jgi:hypothetical protein
MAGCAWAYCEFSGGVSDEDEFWRKKGGSLSTNDDLPWLAVLLVFSNHWPASLLSPELVLLESSCGETLDGGLALSLARFGELCVVVEALAFRLDEAGGLWRRDTDWWAGGRRGWDRAAAGMVPGRSFIMAAVQRLAGLLGEDVLHVR